MLKICIPAVQREVSLEQSDEVPHAHKEKVSTDKVEMVIIETDMLKDLMIMESVIINTNSDEDIRRAHIPIKE